ncbi:glucosaminidase domain-containing protein [Cytobacillus horneckiae]|nr:glucosaminidase domain-containing protein [Cytobacillus horneckiae]MEC1154047.1 LysM peptidoglycan-binding domain-containing protein [Cytobacillus horneckiae]MED2938622.1 LysM peptidoglycan-binding domain-containing protein [Cytobacillus horneckiae]
MDFISLIAPYAQKIAKQYNILASLIIAQAIHESNWGKSKLAIEGNNLFGIKGSYEGQSIVLKTLEVNKGEKVYVDAHFRKYPSWYESMEDLARLYKNGVSWDRNKYQSIIGENDYKKAAKAVQAAGYATDPNYANKVVTVIESNELAKYDRQTESYLLHNHTPGYLTAADAKNNKNATGTVESGEYYIYKKNSGMLNLSSKAYAPGSWINPNFKGTSEIVHIVKAGDTLTKIAATHQTTVKKLQQLNKIKDVNVLSIGQKLIVAKESQYYTVKSGDTVSNIAKSFKTTVQQIKLFNQLHDFNKIYPGQKLRVK